MNAKPGTPFIYYAIIASFIMAGLAALFPLLAFPFSLLPISIALSFVVDISVFGLSQLDVKHASMSAPSPVLVVGHACFLAGGWCFNKGNRALGFRLLGYVSAALILYMIPVYPMAVFSSLLVGGNRTVTILSVLAPAIYMGSLVAVLATTVRIGDNLEMGRQIPWWAFARRLGVWSTVAAMPVVVAVLVWRVTTVPQHQISVVNETGRPIYLGTVRIGDFVDDFHDSYVFPFQETAPQMGGRRRFTVGEEIILANVGIKFRFDKDERIREYSAMIFSSWYVDCSFVIAIRAGRIDASKCQTENIRKVID